MSDRLDRRLFLQASTAMLAAGAFASNVARAADEKPSKRRVRKAVKLSMVGGNGSLVEKFKMLKEIGYKGIDMDRPADHDEVKRAMDESGLIVHGVVDYVHWKQPLSHPDPQVREQGLEGLKTSLRDSKAYGGTTVLLVPGVVSKEVGYGDAWTRSQAEIRKALPLAEELGIRILFENVWSNFLISPVEMAHYIDEFNHPLIGSYFDIGNIVRYGWPEQWIRVLGKRIGKLDIKEYSLSTALKNGNLGAGFNVPIGEGDVDWRGVMQALADIGYEGWGTAEVRGGDRERLQQVSQEMDRVLS